MTDHPYLALPASAYWRQAVADVGAVPDASYCTPKWPITRTDRIATAGSCFAQHIGRHLRAAKFAVLDAEPAPALLAADRHLHHGYGLYSARYGNIYTARQMLQLAQEALGELPMSEAVWQLGPLDGDDGGTDRGGPDLNGPDLSGPDRYVDALRPTIDPHGHASPAAVLLHRRRHLDRVRDLLLSADLLIFTLGLTETWEDQHTGRVLPVCPGTLPGSLPDGFDPARYMFRNFGFQDTLDDMRALRALLQVQRAPGAGPRLLLTVSPVPLTATASGAHVMQATVYSKSVLRAVAGQMQADHADVDYFPSYEIVANPWDATARYAPNLRSVTDQTVARVMGVFMAVHGIGPGTGAGQSRQPVSTPAAAVPAIPVASVADQADQAMLVKCDEDLLAAFGRPAPSGQ